MPQPYPKYRPTELPWLPQIPEHWEVVKVKYVADLKAGSSITSELIQPEGEYPVYGGNGQRGFYSDFTHEGNHVLIGRQGALCGNINYASGRFWASEHAVVVSHEPNTDYKWLGELLRSMNLNQYSESAAQPGISVDKIKNLYIPVPPVKEQNQITAYLDHHTTRLDQLIAQKEALRDRLRRYRQALIHEAVTQGLDPQAPRRDSGLPWLGEVPRHWEVVKLKYVCSMQAGSSITSELITEEGKYPVYGGNGLRGYYSHHTHNGDHVLIGRQGALCGNINYASGQFWASEHAIVVAQNTEIDVYWLGELLTAMNLNQYSESAAQPGISVDKIKNLYIPLPPHDEIKKISHHLRKQNQKIDGLVDYLEKQLTKLHRYRQALITEVVTGQVNVGN